MFNPPRNRDAHAAIRGYVYQIDRTIERWLQLEDNQSLELERGEDIDLIGQAAFSERNEEFDVRLLEQVKRRNSNLTLRSESANESLANFYDHRSNNSSTDLKFCFSTNARHGREQLAPFPTGTSGIALWEGIRLKQLPLDSVSTSLAQIKLFLSRLPRPTSLTPSHWTNWITYVSTVSIEDFRGFVERFEWSLGHEVDERLSDHIRKRIIDSDWCGNESEASKLHDKLFVHVSRLLCEPGIKRLTTEGRSKLIAQPVLTSVDRELLNRLRTDVESNTFRISNLELGVLSLGDKVENLIFDKSFDNSISLVRSPPDLTVPLSVSRSCNRTKQAQILSALLTKHEWVAMYGGPDTGKTQLLIQLTRIRERCLGWIRFHYQQSVDESSEILDSALIKLTGCCDLYSTPEVYAQALSKLQRDSFLVLDDLPRFDSSNSIFDKLSLFCRAAKNVGIRMISTSQFELPLKLMHSLGDAWMHETHVPPFTDEEALELFLQFEAPISSINQKQIAFLNGLASGHPLLLVATAEFLKLRDWKFEEIGLSALLRGDHKSRVTPEVVNRLVKTVGEIPRELLYRLTLPIGRFRDIDLIVLSSVAPPIDRPRERFNELLGGWVQRDSESGFSVSPLTKPLGMSELPPALREECYRQLAISIVSHQRMNQYDSRKAIHYSLLGREFAKAATIYLLLLRSAISDSSGSDLTSSIDMWKSTELPDELNVGTRLTVRSFQLSAFSKFGIDIDFTVRNIDELLKSATIEDGWGIIVVAVQSLRVLRTKDTTRVLRYLRKAIALPHIVGPTGEPVTLGDIKLVDSLWMLVVDLRTSDLINQWFDAVESLSGTAANDFWESKTSREVVWLVPNSLYLTEYQKPIQQQNWDAVLSTLHSLRNRAIQMNRPLLEASIVTNIIDIMGERKQLRELMSVARGTFDRFPNDPNIQFRIRGACGRVYAYGKQPDRALSLLNFALEQAHWPNDHERLRSLLAASRCVENFDLQYIEQARELAISSSVLTSVEAARALGEFALSHFYLQQGQKGAIAAFQYWSDAMRRLLDVQSKDKLWRDAFVLFGHITGHLAQLAIDGTSQDETLDGERSIPPSPGILQKDYMPEREQCYRAGSEAGVLWLMRQYASASSSEDESIYWMKQAIQESREYGQTSIKVVIERDAVVDLLASEYWEDAVEAGKFAGRGLVVLSEYPDLVKRERDGETVDFDASFKDLSQQLRFKGDDMALIIVLIPATFALVRLSLLNAEAAVAGARRVADACRVLSEDDGSHQEMWRTSEQLFLFGCDNGINSKQILAITRQIAGADEGPMSLRILGLIIATWRSSPADAIHCQLSCVERLLTWFSPDEPVYRFLLMPYVQEYWQKVAREQRFAFRNPSDSIPEIEAALTSPERVRVRDILLAASGGFRISGLQIVVERLRNLRHRFPSSPKE